METSLTQDDVELIAMKVEERLSDVSEHTENHKDSILEKIQEVKTVLEYLKVKTEKKQQKITTPVKEGILMGETVKIIARGSVNFRNTPDMLFIDEDIY
jgi:hypothetical protein